MEIFCVCNGWEAIKDSNPSLFRWDSVYGWLITWIELTDEQSYTKIHNYGISITYCPLCSKKLKEP